MRRPPRPTLFPYTTLFRSYSAPKPKKSITSLDEIDPEILKTYEKLGIPLREVAMLEGVEPKVGEEEDRKSTRLNSSHVEISYAVFCLKKKRYVQLSYFIHD